MPKKNQSVKAPGGGRKPGAAYDAALVPFFRSKVNLFESLPDAALQALARACVPQKYAKDELICRAGEPADAIWIVKEGLLQLNRCSWQGLPMAIEVLVPGDACGFASLGDKTWPVNAAAKQDSSSGRSAASSWL